MHAKSFFLFLLAIALAEVLVPYVLFKETRSFLGSYLYWSVVTLVMIVFAFFYTRRWREEP